MKVPHQTKLWIIMKLYFAVALYLKLLMTAIFSAPVVSGYKIKVRNLIWTVLWFSLVEKELRLTPKSSEYRLFLFYGYCWFFFSAITNNHDYFKIFQNINLHSKASFN